MALPKFICQYRKNKKNMEKREKSEQLIDQLIKKRKEENEAFSKLLNAIGSKTISAEKSKNPKRDKPCL